MARSGDVVSVAAGTYPTTDPAAGATTIYPDASKTSAVTFTCQSAGEVTFAAPNFALFPGAGFITIRGSCFRFHSVRLGYGGYSLQTHDVTLDGVHMDAFECAGCLNSTITHAEVGPVDACYAPGATGNGNNGGPIDPTMWCDPHNPTEAYWASLPSGTAGQRVEPFVHNNGALPATNFALLNTRIHGINTRDPFNMHAGGLLLDGVDGLTLRGDTFDHNVVYDVLINGSTAQRLTVVGNVFGWPVTSLAAFEPKPGAEAPTGFVDFGIKPNIGVPIAGWLIRGNLFSHGLDLEPQSAGVADVRVAGNVLGSRSTCLQDAVYDHNVGVASGSACGGLQVSISPYVDYDKLDFRLNPKSKGARYLQAFLSPQPAKKPPQAAKKPKKPNPAKPTKRRKP